MGAGHNFPVTVNGLNQTIIRTPKPFLCTVNERLNKDCSLRARILPKELEATSSPTVELAMELAQKAFIPKLTLRHWIEQASVDEQLISVVQVKNIDGLKITDPEEKNNILNRELKRVSIIDAV